MKKSIAYLLAIAFLFAVAISFAGDQPTAKSDDASKVSTAPTATSTDPKTDNPHAGCPMMSKGMDAAAKEKCAAMCGAKKGDAKASTAAQNTETKAKVEAATEATAIMSKTETDAKAAEAVSDVKLSPVTAKADEACPDVTGKKQMESFHEILHPMHMALNDAKYDDVRKLMPELEKAATELKAAQCPGGDKCPADCKKNYETKKANLMNTLDEVKTACNGTDNAKLDESFKAMHTAYIEFAASCKMPLEAEKK